MVEVIYVGVDVSKETLDIALHPSGEYWQEKNDKAGRTILIARLEDVSPEPAVLSKVGVSGNPGAVQIREAERLCPSLWPASLRESLCR